MRVLILVRTAILIFFSVGACFGVASHTRRNEHMDTKNASKPAVATKMVTKKADTIDGAHGKDKSSFNVKNDEARSPKLMYLLGRLPVHVDDPNFEEIKSIEELARKLKVELTPQFKGDVFVMKKHVYWQFMEEGANGWLQEGKNPQTVFSFLKLDTVVHEGTDLVTMKYDPTLIFWFHYVTKYRLMDSTGSDYAAFNNKELLEFLAYHIREQNNLKLTLALHDHSLFNPYVPVVSLFDFYRNEPGMDDFAADMLAYMLTDSITKDLVFEEWLSKKQSPKTIFEFLLLGENVALKGTDDVTLFTAWLQYVKKYLYSGAMDFDPGRFIEKYLPTMLLVRAKVMFESNAVENVLGDVRFQTGNLAAYVRDIWHRYPQLLLNFYDLSDQEITSFKSSNFVEVVSSMAVYMESKPFNGDLMFDSLNVKHSFDQVVNLFWELERTADSIDYLRPYELPLVKNYAHTMVQYLFDSSIMLRLHGRPEIHLDDLIARNVDVSGIKNWFLASVMYFQRVKNELLNDAIISVIHLLQKKLPDAGDSRVSWLTIVGQLRNEDARINSAIKLLPESRI